MKFPNTPLSSRMNDYFQTSSIVEWNRFLEEFVGSSLGVVVVGEVPSGIAGRFTTTREHPLALGLTNVFGFRNLILAYADPPTFAVRFGEQFNATIEARELLACCLHNPDCEGILINCATDVASTVVSRECAQSLFRLNAPKPWWKFW